MAKLNNTDFLKYKRSIFKLTYRASVESANGVGNGNDTRDAAERGAGGGGRRLRATAVRDTNTKRNVSRHCPALNPGAHPTCAWPAASARVLARIIDCFVFYGYRIKTIC